jgi:CspA family cold shock protein
LTRGYGFISPNDGGSDAFVHISAVERAGMHSLDKDQRVTSHELETDQRGKTFCSQSSGCLIDLLAVRPARSHCHVPCVEMP